jgi:hypothetical protein
MARTVIVHVGAPKTGTSFVQDLLFNSRDRLAERGICYPAERFDAHFLAALDLMQLTWGGLEREAVGAWDRLAAEVRACPGTAIDSHEILATASRVHVARALDSLSTGDTEIHLVFSARDLVRQIPAEWQENVKHRRTTTYTEFLEHLQDPSRQQGVASWFWGVQEVPDVLDRWGATLPRERVHLVTVPPAGAPQDLLWQRFSRVLGLDPAEFPLDEVRTNPSLGVAEATVVRRLNEQIAEVVPNHHYRALVREALVHRGLSTERRSAPLSVPPEVWTWASELSRQWVTDLALRGYDVVGDLDDLLPAEPLPFVDPDQVGPEEFGETALRALTLMTVEGARLRDREVELMNDVDELIAKLDAAHSTPIYKAKEKLVARAGTSRAVAVGLGAYRRLRGRNSRST